MSEIKDALSFDAFSAAEEITGKSYKTDTDTETLGVALHMMHGQSKKELLRAAGDTYWAMPLPEWLAVVKDMGFKEIFSMPIPGTKDTFLMFWMPGILLKADTYLDGKSLNGATAYFNFKGPRRAMNGGSSGHAGMIDGQDVWDGSRDAREGFRFAITQMQEAGELLPVWVKPPFLWLLHYMDTKTEGYDYQAINAERIAMLPADVQAAIGGESWRPAPCA